MNKFKKALVTVVFLGLIFNLSSNSCFAGNSLSDPKIRALTETLYSSQTAENINSYILLQKKRAKTALLKRDYIEATDAYRSILYFLSKNKKSGDYIEIKKKLEETISKAGFENDNYNRLEVAKNLYLECEYFASAYEFSELLKDNFETATCYEYLGDISQKIDKNRQNAINYYKMALEIEPDNPNVLFKLANILNKMNKGDLALEYYTRAINLSRDPKILKEGIMVFERAIKRHPRYANLYEILGTTYEKAGNFDKTYEYYQKAIYLNPKDIFLKYKLGGLFLETKRYDEAIRIYNIILEDNPYDTQIRAGRAKCYTKLNNTNLAIKDYQIILAIYPNSKQAQFGIYSLLAGQKSLDEIISVFYPLNKSFVADSAFYTNFAELLADFGQNKDAISLYNRAISKDPKKPDAYLKLYELYELNGQDVKAKELLKLAYKNIPSNAQIKEKISGLNSNKNSKKDELALTYIKNGEWEKAIKIYNQIEPKTAQIYISIANCYKNLERHKLASENYKKAIEFEPDNSDIYYFLALSYLDLKSPKLAEATLKKAVELNEKNVKAVKLLNYLSAQNVTGELNEAYNYFDKNDYKTALNKLNTIQKKYPTQAQVYFYRGSIYEKMGNFANAIKDYQTTIQLNRSFSLAYFSLASAYEKYGRGKDALTYWEKYLSLEPNESELVKQAQQKVIELGEKYY